MSTIANLTQVPPATLAKIIQKPSRCNKILLPQIEGGDLENYPSIDTDVSWEGIHFLLTGKHEGGQLPLANTLLGGTSLPFEFGYGAVRYLTPSEVKEIAQALKNLSHAELAKRYDPVKMVNVYSMAGNAKEDLPYLLGYFVKIDEFYQQSADNGNALLLYFT